MLEDDADLATFFDAGEHGTQVTFTPAVGAPSTIVVVADIPREIVALGFAGAAQYNVQVRARAVDIAAPDGGQITFPVAIAGCTVFDIAEATRDETGATWLMPLKPTA